MSGKGSFIYIILIIEIESLNIYLILLFYLILLYSTSTLLQQTSLHLVQF
jgi:hypothetical protein